MKNLSLSKNIKFVSLFTFLSVFCISFFYKNLSAQNFIVKVLTENNDKISVKNWSKKLKSIIESNDLKEDWQTAFVLKSNFVEGDVQVIESGMQKLTACRFTLELELRNWFLNTTILKENFTLTGTGSNHQEAFGQAINKVNNKQFAEFCTKTKAKIADYYQKECKNILEKVQKEEQKENYEKALIMLAAIPDDISCSKEVGQMQEELFFAHQSKECAKLLLKAKIAMAAQKYEEALEKLGEIHNESDCEKNRDEMINEIAKKYEEKSQIEKAKNEKSIKSQETQKQIIDLIFQQQLSIIQR